MNRGQGQLLVNIESFPNIDRVCVFCQIVLFKVLNAFLQGFGLYKVLEVRVVKALFRPKRNFPFYFL